MNAAKYVEAYGQWQKSIPFQKAGAYREALDALIEYASPEHKPVAEEVSYMADQVKCACGWESLKYFDGVEYAMRHWREHVMDDIHDG